MFFKGKYPTNINDPRMRTLTIPPYIIQKWEATPGEALAESNKKAYSNLYKGNPVVSVVIPAYNEEKNILQTLSSLCNNKTRFSTEIIVVNNNSADNTGYWVEKSGVVCILETKKGITAARNTGLAKATGRIVLNADADTIYPETWIEEMASPLESKEIGVTYGRFSFIPTTEQTGRATYILYEYVTDVIRLFKKYTKDEAVNVFGFNSGFKRVEGLAVDGFIHPPGANEDGYLALKIRDKGFGRLHQVNSPTATVWTSDRRIQMDGGLIKGSWERLQRLVFKKGVVRNDL